MPSTKKCALSLYFCFLLGIHLEIDQKLVRVRYTAFIGCSSRVKAISMNLEEKATLLLTKVVVAGVANEIVRVARKKIVSDVEFRQKISTIGFNLGRNIALREDVLNFQVKPHELVCMSSAEMCTAEKKLRREQLVKKELSSSKVSAEYKRAQIELFDGLQNVASTKKARIGYQ
jgi:hypothetical protein